MADLIDSQETVTQNVDVRELTEGLDVQTYYLAQTSDSSGINNIMTKSLIYSNNIVENHDNGGDDDYDSDAFNRPRTLDGTIHFTGFIAYQQNDTPPALSVSVKVYHYDGSTETQLGSTWTAQSLSPAGTQKNTILNGFVTLSSPKKFRKGDKIRFNLITTATTTNVKYGTDPQNRSSGSYFDTTDENQSTQFIVRVPFKSLG
jgi:hypothetical protein